MTAPDRPVLLYDGDCGFCTSSARWIERRKIDAAIIAWQFAEVERYGITAQQASSAVQWVAADGRVSQGHEAIARALGRGGLALRILGKLLVLPGISAVSGVGYRLISKYRDRLPGGTAACVAAAPDVDR
jgi:predicted DCC family thiol-disulfide oxidoreductase YuxK